MGCRAADANIVRTKEQARAVAIDVLRRLKAGEEFTRLVLDYSDEPNAGRRGGSLPPFGHGTMDKAFEAAAFALAPGELSGVVETQFGYHVIQRLE
jgi:parvulin-like peptidyl-prolyl isomerase